MVNKRFWLGILVIVLVFGMTVVGCDNDSTSGGGGSTSGGGGSTSGGGGANSALNGTWVRTSDDFGYEFTLNNGNFEGRSKNGILVDKGTYTNNNGTMTMKSTHFWGESFSYPGSTLDAKWYTKSEIQSAIPSFPSSSLDAYFQENTWTYSVSGNTFTRTLIDGSYTQIYTKK